MGRIIMKRKLTIAVLLILLAVFMAGACFFAISTLSDYRSWRVITLKDLSDDDQLRAVPQNLVVVAFWEGTTGASAGEPIAVIPYTFTYDSGFTFCWEADYPTLNEYMALHFSGGRELVRIDAGDGCVTEVLPSGAYEMRFYRDDVASLVPIFVRPYPDAADPMLRPARQVPGSSISQLTNVLSASLRMETSIGLTWSSAI